MWIWLACTGGPEGSSGGPTPSSETVDPAEGAEGLELLERIGGLWTGPATETPLGDFPRMNVDLRAADAHAMWGRVDLDPENALRFALAVEDHGGPTLIYRNGGYFLGLLRDDRTALVEADPDAGIWRFCHLDQGCSYVEATWTLSGDDLQLDVDVREAPHVRWSAGRAEDRPAPEGFPDPAPLPPDAPLPTLPTLGVTVRWSTPLAEPADVWVILSTSPCGAACVWSRTSRAAGGPGATEVLVELPEIHAGDYLAAAVLDRDRNLAGTMVPGPTDGVSLPNRPITVAPEGATSDTIPIALGG